MTDQHNSSQRSAQIRITMTISTIITEMRQQLLLESSNLASLRLAEDMLSMLLSILLSSV